MPSFEQNKSNKLWSVRFRVLDESGLRKNMRLSGFKTKREAQHGYEDYVIQQKGLEEQRKQQEDRDETGDNSSMAMDDLIDKYFVYVKGRVKESSFYDIEGKINNHIRPFFSGYAVNEVSPALVLEWTQTMSGYSYNYTNRIFNHLSSIMRYSHKYYDIPNVMEKVDRPRNLDAKKEMQIWTQDEFLTFIKSVNNRTHAAMFWFLYVSGCRRGEAAALSWEDFDFDSGTVRISKSVTTKTKSGTYSITTPKNSSSNRIITLPPFMIQLLKDYKTWQADQSAGQPIQFAFGGSSPVPPSSLDHAMKIACDRSGVKKIRVHDLRHSCASLLISSGASIVAVSHRLGHADVTQTLNTYAHLMPDDQKLMLDTFEKLGTLLGTKS